MGQHSEEHFLNRSIIEKLIKSEKLHEIKPMDINECKELLITAIELLRFERQDNAK